MESETYDVLVLGGGAGGVPAAIRAANLGGRVAIIEARDLGGLCMNRGCVPFCNMMAASDILGDRVLGKEMGLDFSGISHEYGSIQKRQKELINLMKIGVKGLLKKNRVRIIEGKGRLIGKGKVEVHGETVMYKNLILATGGVWVRPEFPGAELEGVITTDGLLEIQDPPRRVLLFGESRWLIEVGQFLQRFGSKVTLATESHSLLPEESKTIRSRLTKVLRDQGIQVFTRAHVLKLTKDKDGLHALLDVKDKQESIIVDGLVFLKRKSALEGLGLNTVGFNEDSEYLSINERMETKAPGIFAIGDLTAPEQKHFSHSASTGGIIAAENAMGLNRRFNPQTVPRVLFTQPQVACVGMTGKEAKDAGYDVVLGSAPLSMNTLGMILSQAEGIIEVVSEKKYGEILGIHIIGKQAGEMIGQGVLAIQLEATLEDLSRSPFPHPTLSEFLAEAAREALGQTIYIP
jgi:dihydrolipoamide dehydrogenase